MQYFTWEPSLDLGIEIIDKQHRRIVDYINMLYDALSRHESAKVDDVLNQLVDYTVTHFAFEESLMAQAGYPYIEAHTNVHRAFTDRIHNYKTRLAKGEDIGKHLLSDLRIWLTNHIKQEDRDYANKVQAHMKTDSHQGWLSKALGRFFGGATH